MEALSKAQKFGSFSIHANLAKGGMADVLLATSEKEELTSQLLALKKLLPHLNSNKAFVNLLIHEAKVGVLLTHPNIVSVFDLGSHKSEFFIAMEYIHGKSIDQVFKALKNNPIKSIPFELASYITMEIVRALAFAHDLKDNKGRELNIIHRDISPGNILLSYIGDVKLSDFGISTAEHRLQPFITSTALGKLHYIPPEQALNDPAQRASDLYSLSVLYFQMMTGNLPFDFKSLDDLIRSPADFDVLNEHLKIKAPEMPEKLREFLARCLNRSPKNRPQSASEYFHTLKEILLEELEVDYFARATRQYFKKRLAEFLKSIFLEDFDKEKNILYRALNPNTEVIPEKKSAGIEDQGVFDMPTEATLLEDDIESEPTSVSNPMDAETSAGFVVPTVADSKISVEKKLKISSLSKDQHEDLQDSLPSLEILSEADEDTFDVKTLGVAPPPHSQKTPHAIKPFNLQNTKPVANIKHRYSDSFPIYAEKLRKSFVTSVKFISTGILKIWMPIVAFVVALTVWLFVMRDSTSAIPAFLPTQTVQIYTIGEVPQDQMDKFISALRDGDKSGTKANDIETFFNKEFFRHSKSFQKVLLLNWSAPSFLRKKISTVSDLQPLLKSDKLFSFISENGGPKIDPKSLSLILYLMPYDTENSSLLNISKISGKSLSPHVLFVPAHPSQVNQALLLMAGEIARMFGATVKLDPATGMPIFPSGYADPDLKPLLPQNKAELMGEYIPIHSIKRRIPNAFSEVVIGRKTAEELGWFEQ